MFLYFAPLPYLKFPTFPPLFEPFPKENSILTFLFQIFSFLFSPYRVKPKIGVLVQCNIRILLLNYILVLLMMISFWLGWWSV